MMDADRDARARGQATELPYAPVGWSDLRRSEQFKFWRRRAEKVVERSDWLAEGLNPAETVILSRKLESRRHRPRGGGQHGPT